MARVLLAGAFGQRNPGDEALLEAFLRALPGCDFVVTTARPGWTEHTYGCDAVDSDDPWAVAQALLSADVVVLGGGTIFKTLHPSAGRAARSLLVRSLALVTSARTLGRRVAAVGVGAGLLADPLSRRLARELVRRIDLLVLRDEESAHLLRGCGAPTPFRVGSDPAWTLLNPPLNPPPHTGGRYRDRENTVLVALSHLAATGKELSLLLDRLAEALAEQSANGLRVLLQPWQVGSTGADDREMASYLRARLAGSTVLAPPADLAEARASAASARLLVAMRFHALLAGAAAGTPVVAVAHEAKLAGLARRLGQPAVRPDAPAGELAGAIRRAGAGTAAGTSPASVQAETAQAEEGFRLLRLLIDHERWDETDTLTGLRLEAAQWAVSPPERV